MKKMLITLGSLAVVLLMISSATAVPTTNSKVVIEKIDKIENIKSMFDFSLEKYKGFIKGIFERVKDFYKGSLLNKLLQKREEIRKDMTNNPEAGLSLFLQLILFTIITIIAVIIGAVVIFTAPLWLPVLAVLCIVGFFLYVCGIIGYIVLIGIVYIIEIILGF